MNLVAIDEEACDPDQALITHGANLDGAFPPSSRSAGGESGTMVPPVIVTQTALATLFAFLGAWVLAARPGARPNRILAAFLILSAGSAFVYGVFRAAPDYPAQAPFLRILIAYDLPLFLLILLLVDDLFLGSASRARRRVVLWLGLIVVALLLGVLALRPALYISAPSGGDERITPGPLGVVYGVFGIVAYATVVPLAARIARSPEQSLVQRRQAALLGVAFAILVAHGGATRLSNILTGNANEFAPGRTLATLAGLVGLALVAVSARALTNAFEGRARRLAWSALVVATLLGALDFPLNPFIREYAPIVDLFWNTRSIVQTAFGVVLAIAVVRFGLAGISTEARGRLTKATSVVLVLSISILGLALTLRGLGPDLRGMAIGVVVAVAPLGLALTPLRSIPRKIVDVTLLDVRDPEIVAERARIYAAALREATRGQGATLQRSDPRLVALREELGLSDRDHAVLASLVADQPARAGDARLVLGRYRIEREIAVGGTARLHLATDTLIRRDVVVKEVMDTTRDPSSAMREIRALGRVSHPRVLTLFDAQQVGNRLLVVLEHAPGGSLAERLRAKGPLPAEEVRLIADDLLDALDAVHAAGLVHGDVKAENIVFGAEGRIRLADFGSARLIHPDPDTTAPLTSSSGTLASMAPEQVLGEAPTPASDLYAAAALVYRMLTGEHYLDFSGATEAEARGRILHREPRLPAPRVPLDVGKWLAICLQKSPRDRVQDAKSLRAALRPAWL